ncbi:hypothetical protein [Polluticaenibacter yanchengensis]|uniref:Uncharacterized protein n=1 Tax=Polluticaenibacter yanchengensis TaxID=3014562 RepID=A0ABT4UIK6_9BACT|nr:hypothetical protein [Chitinophagaceae bacterium LY-5]
MSTEQINKKISKSDEQKLEEKMRIISEADRVKGEQFSILPDGEIEVSNELKQLLQGNVSIDDPGKKYDLYYKGIERILRKHLPKGKQYKKARSYIREEKSVFLTRGKRIDENGFRHADSRMGYVEDAQQILNMLTAWVLKGGTMVELYNDLRALNITMGYGQRIVY